MAMDPKAASTPPNTQVKQRDHGIQIFTYPKLIFIFPTMIAALICGIGMELIGDRTTDPIKVEKAQEAAKEAKGEPVVIPPP